MDYFEEEFDQYLESTVFIPATKPLLCVEVFSNKAKSERIVRREILEDDVDPWLEKACSSRSSDDDPAVYIVSTSIDQENYSAFDKERWHMQKSIYRKIHQRFNLSRFDSGIARGRDVIVEYVRGRVTSGNTVSHWASTTGQYLWTSDSTGATRGIVQLRDNEDVQRFLTSLSTYIPLGDGHSTMLVTTLQLDAEKHRAFALQTLNDIQSIENSTGYDYFTKDRRDLNPVLLKDLNLRLSKTRQLLSFRRMQLSGNERKLAQCGELLNHLAIQQFPNLRPTRNTLFSEVFPYYKDLTGAFREELVNMETRARIQQDTLYNLIAREDSAANIQLAKDSRRIALASQRDSASMKTISVLTMVFLPGTFVAAMFAMPCFHWFAGPDEPVSSRFWIFWAVTAPLTLGVVLIWWYWKEWRHQQDIIEDRMQMSDAVAWEESNGQGKQDLGLGKSEQQEHGMDQVPYSSVLRLFTKRRKQKEVA